MFQKLNAKHKFHPIPEDMQHILVRFGKEIDGEFFGYTTYRVCEETAKKLLAYVPKKYRAGFEPCLIEINVADLPPHIDNLIHASINFYTDADQGVTTFYKVKPNQAIRIEKLPNQTDGGLFVEEDLDGYAEFTAEPGDIYALAIKQIHGVKGEQGKLRRAYCLKSYEYTYAQILEMLKDKKWLN